MSAFQAIFNKRVIQAILHGARNRVAEAFSPSSSPFQLSIPRSIDRQRRGWTKRIDFDCSVIALELSAWLRLIWQYSYDAHAVELRAVTDDWPRSSVREQHTNRIENQLDIALCHQEDIGKASA